MDQHAGVRQGEALAGRAAGQQDRRRRGRLPQTDRLDLRPDELHRVVNRRHGGERTTRRVDVDADVTVGVERLQGQQLRHDVIGRRVVHLHAEEDDAVLEELGVRVHLPHAIGRALGEGRKNVAAVDVSRPDQLTHLVPLQETAPVEGTCRALRTTWSMKP